MTTMVTEVYDALREAGASEEKSRKAAEAIADYDQQFSDVKSDLKVLKWSTAATFAMTVLIFGRLFIHYAQLDDHEILFHLPFPLAACEC